jgi:HEXXH motif-containing protein
VCRELPGLLRGHAAGPRGDDVRAVERALALLATSDARGAIPSLFRRPHTSTLARTLRLGERADGDELLTELLALVAFDLAWLGALPCRVTLRHVPRRLVTLAARIELALPEDLRAATFENGAMLVERAGSVERVNLAALSEPTQHPWLTRPHHRVRGEILLALADNNPLSCVEAHPDKNTPNTVDLGGHAVGEWLTSLRAALAILDRHLPGMSADVDHVLQQIVPTGYDAEKHLSCSYREDIGTVYLSLHPSPITMAEAIIHEVSHNKLNALFELDPVISNAADELYPSPVRPDLRPLHGVLLAVHAFVPVARMYESIDAEAKSESHLDPAVYGSSQRRQARFAEVIRSNQAGTRVLLSHARPTRVGQAVLAEFSKWDGHFRGFV